MAINPTATPGRDPVTEVFEAVAQLRRASPGASGGREVAVRSRTGQLLARFTPDSMSRYLRSRSSSGHPASAWSTARNRRRSLRLQLRCRCANEAQDHPNRRSGD